MAKIKRILIPTIICFNVLFLLLGTVVIHQKGGLNFVREKIGYITNRNTNVQIPTFPMPSVNERILLIGDSHLAIHPWSEYSHLPFSNRAVGGTLIEDIKINEIEGNPSIIMVSTSTNNLQKTNADSMKEIKDKLGHLFSDIKNKWPEATIIFISEPNPNVEIYESYIRLKHPTINRPTPEQIGIIKDYVKSLGIITIQAKSANVDGLHIDPLSAIAITGEVEKLATQKK